MAEHEAPYGYKRKGNTTIIDMEEAPIRALMYDLYLKEKRFGSVADILNEQGYRTREGKSFSKNSIKRYLTAPTVEELPIISKEIQDEVLKHIQKQDRTEDYPLNKQVHPFTGIIYCYTGEEMTVRSGSSNYTCKDSNCLHSIPSSDLEEIFIESFGEKLIGGNLVGENFNKNKFYSLSRLEKRNLIHQIFNKVIIHRDTVEFNQKKLSPASFNSKQMGYIEPSETNAFSNFIKKDFHYLIPKIQSHYHGAKPQIAVLLIYALHELECLTHNPFSSLKTSELQPMIAEFLSTTGTPQSYNRWKNKYQDRATDHHLVQQMESIKGQIQAQLKEK